MSNIRSTLLPKTTENDQQGISPPSPGKLHLIPFPRGPNMNTESLSGTVASESSVAKPQGAKMVWLWAS